MDDEDDTNATNMKDVSQPEARELGQAEAITNPVHNGTQPEIVENSETTDHAQNSGESKEGSQVKVMSEEGGVPRQALPSNHQNEAEGGNPHGNNDATPQAAMMQGMPQLNLMRGNPYLPFYPMTLTPGLFDGVSERDRILWRNTCPYCYAVKAGPADLQRHLRKHTGERPFVCQVCNKAFKAKRSLQYHQYVHHGIEQTQSNIGEKYADTRKRKMDGEPDPANNSVNPFIKSFYAGLGTQNEATSGGSPFPWLNHGLMWNTLKRTMATATNGFEMPDENGNKKLLLDANTANTATDLSENNNNNGLKNYDLEQKVKVNGSHDPENSGLEKQVSVESNSRMILGRDIEEYLRLRECPFCGKVCPQRSDMKRHLMVHTGEKPFTCEACGKGFKAKGSLMYHQRAAHDMPVELSQGLEERFLRARANKEQRQLQHLNSTSSTSGLIGTDLDEEEIEVELEELEQAGLDQCDTSGSSEQRDGENGTASSGIGSGSSELTPPSSSEKIGTEQAGQGSQGHEGREDDLEEYEDYSLDYPSEFPGLKQSISIKNETVLATRLDGVNRHTGDKVSMYKCHMCGRVFNFLSRLQCHLSMHFDRHLTVYQCALCKANFRFKLQLMNHLRNHGNQRRHYASRSGNPSNPDQDPAEGGSRSPSASGSTQEEGKSDDPGQPLVERYTNNYGRAERLMSQYNRCYVCRYCNKSFFRLSSLQQHERVHSNYKPCNCADCGRGFSEPKELEDSLHRNGDMEEKSSDMLSEIPGSSQQSEFENEIRGRDLSPSANELAASDSPLPGFEHSDARLIPIPQSELGPPLDSPLDCSAPKNLREATPVPENDKDDPIEPGEIRRYPPDVELPSPVPPPPQSKELANEIREKERLDDDVTVVIPTEAPLENMDPTMDAPCSNVSESASWGENVSDTDSSLSNEIVSPPWKSIMAFNKQLKSKRKGSLPQRMTSPSPGEQNPSAIDIRPTPDPERSSPRSESNSSMTLPKFTSSPLSFPTSSVSSVLSSGLLPGAEQLAAAVAAANSAGPIYLPSPVLPPGLLSTQLPLMSTPGGLASSAAALDVLTSSSLQSQLTPSPLPFGLPQSWQSTPTTSSHSDSHACTPPSYNRSSALANRAHSRRGRLNVVRTPVRREDACKPTVLPDGRTVYRCTYCNKDFGSYSDINRHMDFHEGTTADIRPYKCKFCDYYARTNSQLKVHMMRHQGIREFHCKLCNYKGVTQSDLNRHMKSQIHMMKAQNECRLCGEGFVSPKNLEKHVMACQGIRRDTRHSGRIHDDL